MILLAMVMSAETYQAMSKSYGAMSAMVDDLNTIRSQKVFVRFKESMRTSWSACLNCGARKQERPEEVATEDAVGVIAGFRMVCASWGRGVRWRYIVFVA